MMTEEMFVFKMTLMNTQERIQWESEYRDKLSRMIERKLKQIGRPVNVPDDVYNMENYKNPNKAAYLNACDAGCEVGIPWDGFGAVRYGCVSSMWYDPAEERVFLSGYYGVQTADYDATFKVALEDIQEKEEVMKLLIDYMENNNKKQ